MDVSGDASDVLLITRPEADETSAAVRSARLGGARRVLVAVPSGSCLVDAAVWETLAAGACDVFCWTADETPAHSVRSRLERWREIDELLDSELVAGNLIGSSDAFRLTLSELIEIGRFTRASVLITGESGTGKELAARLIHALDTRREKGDLVVVDCTTVVPSLSGSEFFGHERGAFTGAVSAREGAFALGAGGTVFLDEVGELPLDLQAELLRVVQERAYKPVGSNRWRQTDFRLICATNRDLEAEGVNGDFRRDFYFRIAEWTCRMPSLRERSGDIEPLASFFARTLAPERSLEFDAPVLRYLQQRDYAGNVRELRQLVARLVHAHVGPGPITVGDIPASERTKPMRCSRADPLTELQRAVEAATAKGLSLRDVTGIARDAAIRSALLNAGGSVRGAARALQVTERAIQLHRQRRGSHL
ncbi:MAG: sigma 54-interacting transcriptional regulator [Solirubrobacterales bacterium]|nr:sigma 54-interacting transcriptional regulator [Solirubrobacterales bacterium]